MPVSLLSVLMNCISEYVLILKIAVFRAHRPDDGGSKDL
jgi:hypothetical protein